MGRNYIEAELQTGVCQDQEQPLSGKPNEERKNKYRRIIPFAIAVFGICSFLLVGSSSRVSAGEPRTNLALTRLSLCNPHSDLGGKTGGSATIENTSPFPSDGSRITIYQGEGVVPLEGGNRKIDVGLLHAGEQKRVLFRLEKQIPTGSQVGAEIEVTAGFPDGNPRDNTAQAQVHGEACRDGEQSFPIYIIYIPLVGRGAYGEDPPPRQ